MGRKHRNVETAGTSAEAASVKTERRKGKKGIASFFLDNDSALELVLKSVLLLVIPYVYLLLCGLIFDKWLKLYSLTTFIFWSLIVLYIAAVAVIIYAVVRFVSGRRKK